MIARVGLIIPSSNRMVEQEMVAGLSGRRDARMSRGSV